MKSGGTNASLPLFARAIGNDDGCSDGVGRWTRDDEEECDDEEEDDDDDDDDDDDVVATSCFPDISNPSQVEAAKQVSHRCSLHSSTSSISPIE